jgi:putative transposase
MGLRAICQKPRTTVPGEPSERFPCLVDVRAVTAQDQVWATDIPLRKGFFFSAGSCGSVVQARAQLEAFKQP